MGEEKEGCEGDRLCKRMEAVSDVVTIISKPNDPGGLQGAKNDASNAQHG